VTRNKKVEEHMMVMIEKKKTMKHEES